MPTPGEGEIRDELFSVKLKAALTSRPEAWTNESNDTSGRLGKSAGVENAYRSVSASRRLVGEGRSRERSLSRARSRDFSRRSLTVRLSHRWTSRRRGRHRATPGPTATATAPGALRSALLRSAPSATARFARTHQVQHGVDDLPIGHLSHLDQADQHGELEAVVHRHRHHLLGPLDVTERRAL